MKFIWAIIDKFLSLFPSYRAAEEERERQRKKKYEADRIAHEKGYPDRSK